MSYSQKPLAEKLQLKPKARIRIADAPGAFFKALTLPEGAKAVQDDGPADAALLFVSRRAALEARFPALAARLEGNDPMLWIAYPKAGQLETDMTRDTGWDMVTKAGWKPVRQIALDDVWTALRFRRLS